jgi:hypothetical protein
LQAFFISGKIQNKKLLFFKKSKSPQKLPFETKTPPLQKVGNNLHLCTLKKKEVDLQRVALKKKSAH